MDNARNSFNVAAFVRVLRPADGRNHVAGRGGGVVGVHAELCGVLRGNFSRRYPSNSARTVRGREGVGLETLANDAVHNFSASFARGLAADFQRNDKLGERYFADLYFGDERFIASGADDCTARI